MAAEEPQSHLSQDEFTGLPKPAQDFVPRIKRLLEAKRQPDEHDLNGMKDRVIRALNDLLNQSGLEDHDARSHDAILEVINVE